MLRFAVRATPSVFSAGRRERSFEGWAVFDFALYCTTRYRVSDFR